MVGPVVTALPAGIEALVEELRAERERVQDEPDACYYCGRDGPLADAAWDVAIAVLEALDGSA